MGEIPEVGEAEKAEAEGGEGMTIGEEEMD